MKQFGTVCGVFLFVFGSWVPDATAFPVWDGGGGNFLWSTPENWNPTGAPVENDQISLNDSTPRATAVHDSSLTCTGVCDYAGLTIGDSMTLNLDRDSITFTSMLVKGSFTLLDDGTTHDLSAGPIDIAATAAVLTLTSPATLSGTTLDIDAEDDNAVRSFEKAGSGTYTASGQVTITAGAVSLAAKAATLIVSAGTMDVNAEVELNGGSLDFSIAKVRVDSGATFTPDSIDANGGSNVRRRAEIDANADVTVDPANTHAAPDFDMADYVSIDVATGKTFDIKDARASSSATVLTLTTPGTGVFTGDALVIDANADSAARSFEKAGAGKYTADAQVTITSDADASNNAILIVSAGTFDVNAEVELNGATSTGSSIAEVEVQGGTFTPNSFDVNGGDAEAKRAVLDFNVSVTMQGTPNDTTMETVFSGFADVEVKDGVTADLQDVQFADGATDVAFMGETDTTAKVKYSVLQDGAGNDGTVDDAEVRYIGPITAEAY